MQVKTVADALAVLVKRRVMTLAGSGSKEVPSLASEVAGVPVKGSWWAHAQGKLIFKLSNELADHQDVLLTRLGDKVTFVHAKLWPALYRLATDEETRREALAKVSPAASDLFAKVRKAGTLHITKDEKDAAAELEGLVIQTQEHGEAGAHRTVLRDWGNWASKQVVSAAKKLDLDRARKQLAEVLGWGATLLAPAPVAKPVESKGKAAKKSASKMPSSAKKSKPAPKKKAPPRRKRR